MAAIEWDESYSVGVWVLDEQHKNLIRLINMLSEEEWNETTATRILAELDSYVREHFHTEEMLMERAGYRNLEKHKDQHKGFTDWLASVKSTYDQGNASAYYLAGSVNAYLKHWLVRHILATDMGYKGLIPDVSAMDLV